MLFRLFQLSRKIFTIFFVILPWTFFLERTINPTKVTRKVSKAIVCYTKILNNGLILYISAESIIKKYIIQLFGEVVNLFYRHF